MGRLIIETIPKGYRYFLYIVQKNKDVNKNTLI